MITAATTKPKRPRNRVGSRELVRLLRAAETRYKKAVKSYEEAGADGRSSFWEHNQASYAKGKRDAYRDLLKPNDPSSGTAADGNA